MDRLRLEYERKKKGVTVDALCKHIGISRVTYYRKLNGTSEFTQGEIQMIIDLFDLESPMGIFFSRKES